MKNKYVYIIIDNQMHSYESICGIYDSFEGAMESDVWVERGETPDSRGFGEDLFIYREMVKVDDRHIKQCGDS